MTTSVKLVLVGVLTVILVPMTTSTPTKAHAPGVVLVGLGTATIDGVMSCGEWDPAAKIDFLANVPLNDGGGITPATLFAMNDGTNLYLGVKVMRTQLNTGTVGFGLDQLSFSFDNDHDGVYPEEGDDILLLSPGLDIGSISSFFDEVRTQRPPCSAGWCGFLDVQLTAPGTNDGTGAATNNRTFSFFEISHPLNSADDLNDFSLTPGSTVGFGLKLNLSSVTPYCSSGCVAFTYFPSVRGDIVIAFQVITVAIDIKPGSYPNSINSTSYGNIPVAILSGPTFDAPANIGTTSLTFGRTGDEDSLAFWSPEDVNGDGFLDLICHFDTQQTDFQSGDTEGVLKGMRLTGAPIIGTDSVSIVP